MNLNHISSQRWPTASLAHLVESHAVEQSALGRHLAVCKQSSTRLHALQRGAEAVHGFLAARFVTTLVIIALLIAASTLAL